MTAGYFLLIIVEDILHDIICIIIVIAVFRSLVSYKVENILVSLKVIIQCFHKLRHCHRLLIKDIVFHSGKTVCDRSDTNSLDILGIISCSPCVVVLSFGNTVVCNDGKERSRHVVRVDLFDDVVSSYLDIDKMFHLFLVRFIQIFIGSKICCLSGLKPDLLPGALIETIVQCDLKNLRQIEISGQDIRFVSECPCLYTSTRSAFPCVLQRFSCI